MGGRGPRPRHGAGPHVPAGTLLKSPWPRAVELHLLGIRRRPSVSPASSPSALSCGIWAGAGGSSSHLHPAPWRGLDTQPAAHGLRSPPGGSQCSGLGGEESSHLCCFFNKEGGLPGPTSRKNSSAGSHVPALHDELLQTEHHVAPKDTDADLNQHCLKRAPKGPFQGHRCAVGLFKHRSNNGPIAAYDSVFS